MEAPQRTAGAMQALAIIVAMTLPLTPLLSLVPNLPQLFQHFAGVPYRDVLVPLIVTLPSVCVALLAPFAGSLVDRLGRRRMLLAASLIFAVCGLLPLWLHDLRSILAAQFGVGIGEAIILPACNALLGDYFQGESRQRWLGFQGIFGAVLATLVVLAGGALGTVRWNAPFLLNALGLVVFAWVLLFTWEPARSRDATVDSAEPTVAFPWRVMSRVFAVTVPMAILYFIQTVQLGLIFSQLGAGSPVMISVLTTVASVGVMVGGWWFRRQSGVRPARHIALILLAYGIGLAGLGLAPGYLAALPFALVAQFGNGLVIPVLVGWSLGLLEFQYRGRGMGLWTTCFFAGQFVGPALFALLVRGRGGDFLGSLALVGAACVVVGVVLSLAIARRPLPATA